MKLPRNLSGTDLIKALGKVGYTVTRQKSSHIRLSTDRNGQHHITIPHHDPVKIGTLAGILSWQAPPAKALPFELALRPPGRPKRVPGFGWLRFALALFDRLGLSIAHRQPNT